MKTLKHVVIAGFVLTALAVPVSAKTVAEEIWDQINQTMPHRPAADPSSVVSKSVAEEIWDQINQTMPHRPQVDEQQGAMP